MLLTVSLCLLANYVFSLHSISLFGCSSHLLLFHSLHHNYCVMVGQLLVAWFELLIKFLFRAHLSSGSLLSQMQNFNTRVTQSMIAINVILYLSLLALVLAFNFAPTTTTTMYCGTAVDDTSGDDVKHVVSIVYAALIAGVSLIIGLAFIIYGRKLLNTLASHGSQKERKLTKVCCMQWQHFVVIWHITSRHVTSHNMT